MPAPGEVPGSCAPVLLARALAVLVPLAAPSAAAALLLPDHVAGPGSLGLLAAAPQTMAMPVTAAEGLGVRGTLRRSRRLVQGRFLAAFAVLAATLLASGLPVVFIPSGSVAAGVAMLLRPILCALAALTAGVAYIAFHRG